LLRARLCRRRLLRALAAAVALALLLLAATLAAPQLPQARRSGQRARGAASCVHAIFRFRYAQAIYDADRRRRFSLSRFFFLPRSACWPSARTTRWRTRWRARTRRWRRWRRARRSGGSMTRKRRQGHNTPKCRSSSSVAPASAPEAAAAAMPAQARREAA
jgi:hypothetical protein